MQSEGKSSESWWYSYVKSLINFKKVKWYKVYYIRWFTQHRCPIKRGDHIRPTKP
jgi:hypothetical protein